MASGMCPCWADVVQEELLEQLCPDELKEFRDALLEADISEYEFQQVWQSGKYIPPQQESEDDAEKEEHAPYRALRLLSMLSMVIQAWN